MRLAQLIPAILCGLLLSQFARAADQTFITGCDISMLPTLESAGAVFRDHDHPADALQIMRAGGCNLFRVRLFVNPNPSYAKTDGAVQDLNYVRGLAGRIKGTGALFLLDIHYSDSWADPGKQFTPQAWKSLSFEDLRKRVHDYTATVLKALDQEGTPPDWVQVGNEITAGMLWPQGQVLDVPPGTEDLHWNHFAQLVDAGCKAVREAQTPDHPIRIVIHIHGGGSEGMAKYFLGKFKLDPADYDILGLSFYPAWSDSFEFLKQNLIDAVNISGKDVVLAETSYPWKALPDKAGLATLQWPQTPQGQRQYLHDLSAALKAAPGHHGIGFIYWYPEAIPAPGLPRVWRHGYEALFDQTGSALPALDSYAQNGE